MPESPPTRPDLLKLLCILTFVGSGMAAFSNFFIWTSYDEVQTIIEEMDFDFPELKIIFTGGKQFFVAGFLLYSISLAGAIQMWKFKKIGFHLYTAAQLFILLLPLVMIKGVPFSFFGMLITAVFIGGYYSQMRFME